MEIRIGDREDIAKELSIFRAVCKVVGVLLTRRGVADFASGATALQAALQEHMELHPDYGVAVVEYLAEHHLADVDVSVAFAPWYA